MSQEKHVNVARQILDAKLIYIPNEVKAILYSRGKVKEIVEPNKPKTETKTK